jgi:hypothetical protein
MSVAFFFGPVLLSSSDGQGAGIPCMSARGALGGSSAGGAGFFQAGFIGFERALASSGFPSPSDASGAAKRARTSMGVRNLGAQ